jgi:K+-sensing histidine kinase KdpD
VVAAALVPFVDQTRLEPALPLLFLLVICVIATRFGNVAGIIGTAAAGLVFALFLFEPKWSLAIENPASRIHLILMLVAGMVLSDLLGAYSLVGNRRRENRRP